MADLDIDSIKKKKINISIENLVMIAVGIFTLAGVYITLQNDIELAKELPEPEVSRTEYDLKDQLKWKKIQRNLTRLMRNFMK